MSEGILVITKTLRHSTLVSKLTDIPGNHQQETDHKYQVPHICAKTINYLSMQPTTYHIVTIISDLYDRTTQNTDYSSHDLLDYTW